MLEMAKRDSSLNIRIPSELKEQLFKYAERNDVSVTTVVIWALCDFLANIEEEQLEEEDEDEQHYKEPRSWFKSGGRE